MKHQSPIDEFEMKVMKGFCLSYQTPCVYFLLAFSAFRVCIGISTLRVGVVRYIKM